MLNPWSIRQTITSISAEWLVPKQACPPRPVGRSRAFLLCVLSTGPPSGGFPAAPLAVGMRGVFLGFEAATGRGVRTSTSGRVASGQTQTMEQVHGAQQDGDPAGL